MVIPYKCYTTLVPGQKKIGSGNYGCYYYLTDAVTNKPLADTAYRLILKGSGLKDDQPGDPSLFALNGQTDSLGRTAFVKTPVDPAKIEVALVRRIGKGKYGVMSRTMNPRSGKAIPGYRYRIASKCANSYEGITDIKGYTDYVQTETPCEATMTIIDDKA